MWKGGHFNFIITASDNLDPMHVGADWLHRVFCDKCTSSDYNPTSFPIKNRACTLREANVTVFYQSAYARQTMTYLSLLSNCKKDMVYSEPPHAQTRRIQS